MKTLVELASEPLYREQWEALLKSEILQSILAGIEDIFPPLIPTPADCSGSYPAIMLGASIAQQIVLRTIRKPEMFNLHSPDKSHNKEIIRATMKSMGYTDEMLDDKALEKLFAEVNIISNEE